MSRLVGRVLGGLRPPRPTRAQPRLGGALRLNGRFVHVHSVGEGRPVLLLHGCGSLGEEILSFLPPVEGVRWIAPDRPGHGHSEPIPRKDPAGEAAWLSDLIDVMDLGRPQVVAHSLAAGPALWLAAMRPAQVGALLLLAPFCRPTPRRWMPLLRLLTAPRIGSVLRRRVLPRLLPLIEPRVMVSMTGPDKPPPWLHDFPLAHAANETALLTVRAELEAFNAGMAPLPVVPVPVVTISGTADRTARPEWHLPWLAARVPRLARIGVEGAGHLVHHAAPRGVLETILTQGMQAGLVPGAPAQAPPEGREAARDCPF